MTLPPVFIQTRLESGGQRAVVGQSAERSFQYSEAQQTAVPKRRDDDEINESSFSFSADQQAHCVESVEEGQRAHPAPRLRLRR